MREVYPPRDIPPFVMYCVNGKPRSSLLIESTDSMICIIMMLRLYRFITDYNYSRLLHVHMHRKNNANCDGTRFYRCLYNTYACKLVFPIFRRGFAL